MSVTIRAGEVESVEAYRQFTTDVSDATSVEVGVGSFSVEPGAWVDPDDYDFSTDGKTVTVTVRLGNGHLNSTGRVYLWVRVVTPTQTLIERLQPNAYNFVGTGGTAPSTFSPFVQTIRLNGDDYTPDESGLADLGDIAGGSSDAADVSFTPVGSIAATDVQAAVAEVATDAAALVTAEATTRAGADTALDGRLDVLEADPTTGTALAAEATTRAAADTTNANAIAAETARALAVEAAKADLVGGLVPTAQIPALALTATVVVVSQAAMLALTTAQVQPGDLAVRTDGAGTFILTATDPSQLANWTRLNAPTDAVTSVNGQTGTVSLGAADVGADASGLAAAAQAFAIQRGNHTGTQSADTIVDGTTNKVLSAADKTRLANTSGTNTGDQDLSGLVPKSLYDANTILAATTDDTPAALTVAASRFVGRKSTGGIAALTPAEAKTELAITESDVTGLTADLATKASVLTRTAVKTSTYTAALWDLVPCDTSGGAFTVTLPAASGGKGRIAIKLVTAGNTLNLALTGSDKFNTSTGPTSGTLTLANQAIIVESDGSAIWTVTADDIPLSALDARFLALSLADAKGDLFAATADNTVTRLAVGSDGQVLTADAASTPGVKWAAAASSGVSDGIYPIITGAYYAPPGPWTGDNFDNTTNGRLILYPFPIAVATTWDRIAIQVVTGGTTGATVRLGLFASNSDGKPGAVVIDSGALVATSAASVSATISQAVNPGRYWLGGVAQGGAATPPQLRTWAPTAAASIGGLIGMQGTGTSASTAAAAISVTGITGAFSDLTGASLSAFSGQVLQVWLRKA